MRIASKLFLAALVLAGLASAQTCPTGYVLSSGSCVQSATAVNASTINDQTLLPNRTGVAHFGDSISTAACGGFTSPSSSCYVPALDAHYNWTATNNAVAGATLSSQSAAAIVNYGTAQGSVSTLLIGQNDAPNGALTGVANYLTYQQQALAAHLSLVIPNTTTNRSKASGCTLTGSWTTSGALYTGGEVSSTNASTATCTAFGNVVYVVMAPSFNAPVIISVAIDGGTAVQYTVNQTYSINSINQSLYALRIPVPANVTGLTDSISLHSVVVTVVTSSGNNFELCWVAGNKGQFNGQGPILYAGLPYMANGADASYSSVITAFTNVANDLAGDGLADVLVDVNSACGNQTTQHLCNAGDGVHPDTTGSAIITNAFINRITPFATPDVQQAAKITGRQGGTLNSIQPQPFVGSTMSLNGNNNNYGFANSTGWLSLGFSSGSLPYTVQSPIYMSRDSNASTAVMFGQTGLIGSPALSKWRFLSTCDNGGVAFVGACTNWTSLSIVPTSATNFNITTEKAGSGANSTIQINPNSTLFLGGASTLMMSFNGSTVGAQADTTYIFGAQAARWQAGHFTNVYVDNSTTTGTKLASAATGAGQTVTIPDTASGSTIPLTGTPTANRAACWKSATSIGFCSSVVASDGSCTCN